MKNVKVILVVALTVLVAVSLATWGCKGGKPAECPPFTITYPPLVWAPGQYGERQLTASGGTAPYTWSAKPGSLPDGFSLSSGGVLSGTAPLLPPATTRRIIGPFTVTVTDTKECKQDVDLSITITYPAPQINPPDPLDPPAVIGEYGEWDLSDSASGGLPPYTFEARNLPIGLRMTSDGVLKGTIPEAYRPDEREIEVRVIDSTLTVSKWVTTKLPIVAKELPASSSWQGTWSVLPGPGQDFLQKWGWPVSGSWEATFIISDGKLSGSQTGICSWKGSIEGEVTDSSLTFTSLNRIDLLSGEGPVNPQDFVVEATISDNTISGTFRDKAYVLTSEGKIIEVYEITGSFTGTMQTP